MITQKRLQEVLSYNPETGVFTNLIKRGCVKKGAVAGTKHSKGYIQIKIDCKFYLAHRLVWLYVYGNFPENELDHINEIKDDNCIINLRPATRQENLHNVSSPFVTNTSGFRGVSWFKKYQKWQAQISINRKRKHLGLFNTPEEASEVYLTAKRKYHPFWEEKAS
jgi:hypothetical protein